METPVSLALHEHPLMGVEEWLVFHQVIFSSSFPVLTHWL